MAHNQRYRGRDNKWQESVSFIDVEVWGTLAERAEEFYKKGVPVIVEGTLKSNSWKDKDGRTHTKLLVRADRVHLLSFPERKDDKDDEE